MKFLKSVTLFSIFMMGFLFTGQLMAQIGDLPIDLGEETPRSTSCLECHDCKVCPDCPQCAEIDFCTGCRNCSQCPTCPQCQPTYCSVTPNWSQYATIDSIVTTDGRNFNQAISIFNPLLGTDVPPLIVWQLSENGTENISLHISRIINDNPSNYQLYAYIWIDWNHDGDFNDTGELILDDGQSTVSGTMQYTATEHFTVPQTVDVEATPFFRTRIITSHQSLAPSSCGRIYRGDVADYNIQFLPYTPPPSLPTTVCVSCTSDSTTHVHRLVVGDAPRQTIAQELIDDYLLFVEKGILTESLVVALKDTEAWADYVFAHDYQLKSLYDVEKFVQKNKHLPNIPSAEELVKNGLNVNVMMAKSMEKIEELYLYSIQQQKEMDRLKTEQEEMNKRVADLEAQLKTVLKQLEDK